MCQKKRSETFQCFILQNPRLNIRSLFRLKLLSYYWPPYQNHLGVCGKIHFPNLQDRYTYILSKDLIWFLWIPNLRTNALDNPNPIMLGSGPWWNDYTPLLMTGNCHLVVKSLFHFSTGLLMLSRIPLTRTDIWEN